MSGCFLQFDRGGLEGEFAARGIAPVHSVRLLRAYYAANGAPVLGTPPFPRSLVEWFGLLAGRPGEVVGVHRSLDGTQKVLVRFGDGAVVEAVLIATARGGEAAGCVSSQVGCAMGCDFCASTKSGLQRNLSVEEIVDQFLHLKALAGSSGRKLKTIVFMGMGEPMHNLDAVLGAIVRIADPDLGGIGWRQVTVSTVGIPAGIDRLAEADLNVHLAVSLHAPDDATRGRIIPTGRRFSVEEILAATDRFYARTRRVPTIEYTLLAGVNDSDGQAELLAELLRGRRFHVNLIPYNPIGVGVSGVMYGRPSEERMGRFLGILRERKVVAHFRVTKGDDVAAACGQLRRVVG